MPVGAITELTSLGGTVPGKDTKEKTAAAAKQFEALLIGQMLKSMHDDGSGWLGTGEDKTADSAVSLAEEHFAAALSANGGLGLATTIQRGLERGENHKA